VSNPKPYKKNIPKNGIIEKQKPVTVMRLGAIHSGRNSTK